MRSKTDRGTDDEMGLGAKLTLGLFLWKATKGLVKIGALAGAAVLGWRVVSRMFERQGSDASGAQETPAIA